MPQEPVELYSEIDSEGWELRKVEVFKDGSMSFASAERATGSSGLSETSIPSIDDIALDPQFRAVEIPADTFEAIWLKATANY